MDIKKIKSYLGFAIKSGDIVYGVDNILKNKCCLVIYSENLSENSINKLKNYINKTNNFIIGVNFNEMCELVDNDSVLAFGIKNKELAKAINRCM